MKYAMCAVITAILAVGGIARAETPARPATVAERMIQKFDRNGDGALDATELASAIAEHQEHRAAETGKVVKASKGSDIAKAEMLIKRFDTNGDGKLNAAELQSMLSAIQARREARKETALNRLIGARQPSLA
jgi:Ca2+-binding EF-hand superfamily protein